MNYLVLTKFQMRKDTVFEGREAPFRALKFYLFRWKLKVVWRRRKLCSVKHGNSGFLKCRQRRGEHLYLSTIWSLIGVGGGRDIFLNHVNDNTALNIDNVWSNVTWERRQWNVCVDVDIMNIIILKIKLILIPTKIKLFLGEHRLFAYN